MSFTWQGISSDTMKFNIDDRQVYNAPAFDVTAYEVPGRSGDLLDTQNRFKNKDVVYTGFLRSKDFAGTTYYEKLSNGLRALKMWLLSNPGQYHDLTDDYDPGFVRKGFVFGETAIKEVGRNAFGSTIQVTFRCKPFMYAATTPVTVTTKTVSGPIASFSDGADSAPLSSLKFYIEPKQNLNGYANPWPGGGGKNKFDKSVITSITPNGVSYSVQLQPNTQYTMSSTHPLSASNAAFLFFKLSGESNSTAGNGVWNGHSRTLTTGADGIAIVVARTLDGETLSTFVSYDFQIEVGSSATTYEPYSNICPITGWTAIDGRQSGADTSDYTSIPLTIPGTPGTVYGGYWDVLNGKLVVDRVGVDMGDLSWTYYTSGTNPIFRTYPTGIITGVTGNVANIISSVFKTVESASISSLSGSLAHGELALVNNAAAIVVRDTDYTTAPSFTAAMTGQTLVYELATPIEYSVTPQLVNSLLGVNNIWCDSGDTEVGYIAEHLDNQSGFTANPLITITMTGAGNLNVNGKTWQIGSYSGTLYCDTETMDWYDSAQLQNSLVTGDGFPELVPGDNIIFYSGGITGVTIDPRWRAL